MIKKITHYANVGASSTNDKELVPGPQSTYIVVGADYMVAPNCSVAIFWDGVSLNNIISGAYADKYSAPNLLPVEGDGTKKLTIRLENMGSTAQIFGVTIFYEC